MAMRGDIYRYVCDGLRCGGGMVRWQCEVTLIGMCV